MFYPSILRSNEFMMWEIVSTVALTRGKLSNFSGGNNGYWKSILISDFLQEQSGGWDPTFPTDKYAEN